MIDLGMHIGLGSAYVKQRNPNVRVLGLEPNFDSYILANLNFRQFESSVDIFRAAAWYKRCNLTIESEFPKYIGTRVVETQLSAKKQSISFKNFFDGIPINDILEEYDISSIDFLKIDIEGSEKELFNDANSSNWAKKCKIIACETHDNMKPGCYQALCEFAIANNFYRAIKGENHVLYKKSFFSKA